MAPTSVLEPMVSALSADRRAALPRFLQIHPARLGTAQRPKIISTCSTAKRVDKVGNGKAYEMLSCLNGALEYYRTVGGDRQTPRGLPECLAGHRGQSPLPHRRRQLREFFHDDFDLPNVDNVGETCVTARGCSSTRSCCG